MSLWPSPGVSQWAVKIDLCSNGSVGGGGILDRCSLQLCSHLLGYMGSSDTFCLLALLLFPVPSSTLLWCAVVEGGWREGPVLLLC